ncbi:MAG: response regulator [Candidatus Cloacimonadota bacterium]|nr:MAG: response regulator [Candidatus Cloacimonadota bacterium]
MDYALYNDRMKKRILVVDDEKLICWSLEKTFSNEGYEVSVAGSGEQALEMMKSKNFDVVIADVKMPGISGLELLTEIKENSDYLSTEVIIMTAFGSPELLKLAYGKGALDYIEKPLNLSVLKQKVSRVCQQKIS